MNMINHLHAEPGHPLYPLKTSQNHEDRQEIIHQSLGHGLVMAGRP